MLLNTLKMRFARNQSPNVVEWNIRYLYLEVFFAGTLGAIVTYNNLFAVRLGASTALIGILTSAPALIAALTSIPSARFLEKKTHRKAWLFGSLLFMRAGYLVVVVIPNLVSSNPAVWLVAWVVILNVPVSLFNNGFAALLAELVPEKRRAFVFSRRTILFSLTIVIVLAVAGAWLDAAPFPLNFQVTYLVGVILVMGSQYFLMRLTVRDQIVVAPTVGVPAVTHQVPLTRPMTALLFNTFVYQLGLQISAPLFVIYYANTLNVNNGVISVNSAAGTLGVVFGLLLWEAAMRKRSYGWVLRVASLGTWMFPFVVAVSHDFTVIIIANFIVNLLHPAVDLSSLNLLLKLSTPEQRTLNLSYYTVAVSISAFLGPLAAVPLSSWIGIPGVMLMAAGFRLCGGILFNVNRVHEPA